MRLQGIDNRIDKEFESLADRTEEAFSDYQMFKTGAVKFDDFSLKYGTVPISSNEILLDTNDRIGSQKSLSS